MGGQVAKTSVRLYGQVSAGGTGSAAQMYRLHARNVSAKKTIAKAPIAKMAAKNPSSHARNVQRPPEIPRRGAASSIEISLHRAGPADIQCHAMGAAAQQF